jgi:hypothetical protein
LARESGQSGETGGWLERAVDVRRHLARQEPFRVDLAEEFAVAGYLLAQVLDYVRDLQVEVEAVLDPFETAGLLTTNDAALIEWARAR